MRKIAFKLAIAVAFVAGSSSPLAASKSEKELQKLAALTPGHFSGSVDLKDDALEAIAVLTTLKGYQQKRGLVGAVPNDTFIRAFVDKQTG